MTLKHRIGYVLLEHFGDNERRNKCETPKHADANLSGFAVIVIRGELYPEGLVLVVCKECWQHFDDDMNHPNWNLLD
jgi:hypothetical protein